MRHIILATLFAVVALPGHASTSAEWTKLERDAKRSCIAASDFRRPQVSKLVVFGDVVGQVALLVTGTHRQSHMQNARGMNLCLYDRRTQKAAVEEATSWEMLRFRDLPLRN